MRICGVYVLCQCSMYVVCVSMCQYGVSVCACERSLFGVFGVRGMRGMRRVHLEVYLLHSLHGRPITFALTYRFSL